jgi:tRNA dimethylallyltransferase
MSIYKNTVIIIAGPTASGKTALALKFAQRFNTAIISADSRQCFKELNIGVAKPSIEELSSVKHYFINSHSIHEEVTAQVFEQYALDAATKIFEKNPVAIMAGGTGLYIRAFCEGLDMIPQIDALVRKHVIENYERYGLQWLQNEVQLQDPEFWEVAERQNPQRLMRALEVKLATGLSVMRFRKGAKKVRPFNIIKLGLHIPKEQLNKNIGTRTNQMIKEGLVNEAASLTACKNNNALQTVGYKELFDYFDGKYLLNDAIEKIKTNTRHYAKRQLTWFRKDDSLKWGTFGTLLSQMDDYLAQNVE